MRGSFRIARIGGIDIRLHFTFLFILPVLALGFARTFAGFREAALMAGIPPEQLRGSPLFWGTVLAIALFLSVLAHELAHALFAIRKGGKVRDITLLMIGGVSSLEEAPRDPRHEAMMALVGPVASIVLAGVLYVLHLALAPTTAYSLRFAIFYLAGMNLALGLFNLLPAFPMDGGRVLRGLLATRMGLVRATDVAATLGKVFAVLFVFAGFLTLNFFLVLIALFVFMGADAESGQVLAQSVLGQVHVRDLLRPAPPPLDALATTQEAVDQMVRDRLLAVLVRRGEELLGVVALDDVARIDPDLRARVPVADVVRPAPAVEPSANVWDAFRLMTAQKLPLVPVIEAGRLAGVLTHEDVARGLRLYQLQRPAAAWHPERARPRTA
jgi:Zn-dependent protease/CBS domain-containing protein